MTAMKRWIGCTVLMLMLLTGCASKTPVEPAAEPAPEMPVLEAREAYQLAEIPVQKLHDGDEVTVDGVCTFTVKGFGAGKTITADGSTCAGAKASQTLIWVTCSYMNLTQNEVSPGRLIENGTLQLDSGTSDGKSASFAQILPGEAAEIYIFYAIPEDLSEQPLTVQFTISGQTYSYELPSDRTGALTPALPEPEEPKEEPEQEPITLQEPPKQETPTQQEQANTEEPKQETAAPAQQEERADAESETDIVEEAEYYFVLASGVQGYVWRHPGPWGEGSRVPPNEITAYYSIKTDGSSVFLSIDFETPESFDTRDGVWTWNADVPEYLSLIPAADNASATLVMSGETRCDITFTYRTPNGKTMSYVIGGSILKR